MIIDIVAFLINQKNFISCFNRLTKIDEKLAGENILLDLKKNQTNSFIFIGITLICELSLLFMNISIFSENLDLSVIVIWILSCGPLLINGIARIWFIQLLQLIQQRLNAINNFLDRTKMLFLKKKFDTELHLFDENFGYLKQEIFKLRSYNNFNESQEWDNLANKLNENVKIKKKVSDRKQIDLYQNEKFKINSAFLINDKMDRKLIILTRLHDEICECAKLINKMFSFQMLVTMAYAFMSITAQFYFLYCYLVGQEIPILFRSASNICISIIFISYTAYKCLLVIWIADGTRLESQNTGTELHKIANVVDESHFYSICNHLSLKVKIYFKEIIINEIYFPKNPYRM